MDQIVGRYVDHCDPQRRSGDIPPRPVTDILGRNLVPNQQQQSPVSLLEQQVMNEGGHVVGYHGTDVNSDVKGSKAKFGGCG